ncbi:GRF zinc finger protein [Medicago truncatula]|uniref:GRF zinc finger protein n=2 Tax=Medicago truncatula TaxID=3880 RepID=G7JIY8_MEDTR|nr:GRF zinc finger protein [Medicago truncatula]
MGGGGMHKTHKNNNISNKSPSGSWSMSSSSRIDSNRSTIPVPDCNCGLRTTMFKANTTKNPGRPFYTCPFHKNDPRNCGYFIWFDEWEEILGAEEVVNAEEKNLGRNGGREPVNERLLDGREVGKGNAIDAKWKTRLNSKLELMAIDLRMLKYLVFASIIMQFFNIIQNK